MSLAPEIEATYEVLAKMGEGGMGSVYKVRHKFFDEIRVVKILHQQLEATQSIQERFLGEARRGKQLDHPNLAKVLDFSIAADGTAYMVMEYIEGVTLREVLARNRGPLDYRYVLPLAQQVLDALAYLHSRKLVHRDISPDNVMLVSAGPSDDPGPRVKLIDLGIAKSLDATRQLTMAGNFLGKVKYAAPEQFSGSVDGRSDLYSLGVVLYELMTGVVPITGKDNMSIIAGVVTKPPRDFAETDPGGRVPPYVRAAVMRALAKSPNERFQSAGEFAEALREPEVTLVDTPVTVAVPVTVEVAAPPEPVKPRRWLAIAAIVAVLLTAAVAALFLTRRTEPVVVQAPVPETAGTTVAAEPPAPVLERGQLLINALPWGQVTSVKDGNGAEQLAQSADTPVVLSLPAGAYKVQLSNPHSQRSVVLDATVSANTTTRCEAELDRVDADAYVKGLGL
ncbi:MAG TPA: serine/threonine-protein kinase [Thermoanaerobaculia bacterium]|nr:serine/threonine-protein kinase [Thermoanaerobaculia bacterium]